MNRENWPAGVKAVYGFPRGTRREAGRGASEIQSLLFEKSKWTPSKAKDWLAARGFLYGKMDPGGERADYYHFRQTPPGDFARMRMSTNPKKAISIEEVRIMTKNDPDADASYLEEEGSERRLGQYERGYFWLIGIWAEADVVINGTIETIRSGGLWGIESDSDQAYLNDIIKEELDDLRSLLSEIGVSKREVDRAFEDVSEVE